MSREEKRVYIVSCIGMAIAVVASVILMTNPAHAESAKKGSYVDDTVVGEELCPEDPIVAKTGQIREDTASLMPCEDPKAFQEWLETYEQETSEESETATDEILSNGEETGESDVESVPSEMGIEVETEAESRTVYTVNGETLNPDIQAYLYQRLAEFHCEFFFRYALCQIYQESRFNAAAENPNGLDKGICQFRLPYFGELAREAGLVEYDIFNPIDSIYVYTYLMCKYLNETGGDVAMSLSLYYSGYGGLYSSEYVRDVTQWFETMKEVEQ